jgi:hypothetical protein
VVLIGADTLKILVPNTTYSFCGHQTHSPGPAGASVREIMRRTGADIKSWTEAHSGNESRRPARIFLIGVCGTGQWRDGVRLQLNMFSQGTTKHGWQAGHVTAHPTQRCRVLPPQGDRRSMAQAIYVVTAAVDRYKELCEGKYSGEDLFHMLNASWPSFCRHVHDYEEEDDNRLLGQQWHHLPHFQQTFHSQKWFVPNLICPVSAPRASPLTGSLSRPGSAASAARPWVRLQLPAATQEHCALRRLAERHPPGRWRHPRAEASGWQAVVLRPYHASQAPARHMQAHAAIEAQARAN